MSSAKYNTDIYCPNVRNEFIMNHIFFQGNAKCSDTYNIDDNGVFNDNARILKSILILLNTCQNGSNKD